MHNARRSPVSVAPSGPPVAAQSAESTGPSIVEVVDVRFKPIKPWFQLFTALVALCALAITTIPRAGLVELRDSLARQETELARAHTSREAAGRANSDLKRTIDGLRANISQVERQVADAEADRERSEKELHALRDELSQLLSARQLSEQELADTQRATWQSSSQVYRLGETRRVVYARTFVKFAHRVFNGLYWGADGGPKYAYLDQAIPRDMLSHITTNLADGSREDCGVIFGQRDAAKLRDFIHSDTERLKEATAAIESWRALHYVSVNDLSHQLMNQGGQAIVRRGNAQQELKTMLDKTLDSALLGAFQQVLTDLELNRALGALPLEPTNK